MRGKADFSLLKRYDPGLKVLAEGEEPTKKILGLVKGSSVQDFDEVDVTQYEIPVYFPTVGMTDAEVRQIIEIMKTEA
jgi:thiamine biosynthesis protein ThiI